MAHSLCSLRALLLLLAGSLMVSAQSPEKSVEGSLRRLAEKDVLLQAPSGRVLRFRLTLRTEFRSNDGRPVRDSLIQAGDRIAVHVNPDDIETAVYVVLLRPGNPPERDVASAPVEEARIVMPQPGDFGAPASPAPAALRLVVTKKVDAEYSPEARAAGLQGTVMLSLEVSPEGTVGNVRVRRGLGFGLDERAVAAAKQWQYQPFNAKARGMTAAVEIPFRLDSGGPWSLSGWKTSPPPRTLPPFVSPVLTRYIGPESDVCGKDLVYVPVSLTIGRDGKPSDLRVGAGIDNRIAQAAIAALGSWRFRPGKAGGEAAAYSGTFVLKCSVPGIPDVPADAGAFKVGGGVSQPLIVFKVDPEYSEEARKAKYSGSVTLSVVVDTEGRTQDIRVIKALGMGLDDEAIVAVRQWLFKPGMKVGKPVNVRATIEVNFRLL